MCANIICLICNECYISTDEIIATACGHIFHKKCQKYWIVCSRRCYQCPKQLSTADRRIYPAFSDTADRSSENLELNKELEKCKNFTDELQDKLLETEKLYEDLQKKFQLLQKQSKREQFQIQTLEKILMQPQEKNYTFSSMNSTINSSTFSSMNSTIKSSTFSSMNSTIKSSTFSSMNSTIKSSTLNEAYWCILIETLEDELNILSKQLNIELNFSDQKPQDDLSERIMNLIKNVSFMVRVNEKMEKGSEKDQSQVYHSYCSWTRSFMEKLDGLT